MLGEHDAGRAHVRALAELAGEPGPWTAEDRRRLVEHANAFATLLRQHIHKEDAILYPMAEQRLPRAVMARVCLDCEAYDRRKAGSGEHDRLCRLAEELASRHALLAREEFEGPPCGRPCGS